MLDILGRSYENFDLNFFRIHILVCVNEILFLFLVQQFLYSNVRGCGLQGLFLAAASETAPCQMPDISYGVFLNKINKKKKKKKKRNHDFDTLTRLCDV